MIDWLDGVSVFFLLWCWFVDNGKKVAKLLTYFNWLRWFRERISARDTNFSVFFPGNARYSICCFFIDNATNVVLLLRAFYLEKFLRSADSYSFKLLMWSIRAFFGENFPRLRGIEIRRLRDPAVVCWLLLVYTFGEEDAALYMIFVVLFRSPLFLMVRSIKWDLCALFPPFSNRKQNTLDDDRNGRSHGVYDVDKEGTKLGCKTLYSRFRENKPTPASSIDRAPSVSVCGLMDVVFSFYSSFCYF